MERDGAFRDIPGERATTWVTEDGAAVAVPCTCGELFQGSLDGEPCLVSCPIDIYSVAQVLVCKTRTGSKVQRALSMLPLLTAWTERIAVSTPLPVGRGYGTSTADIGAALYAAGQEADIDLGDALSVSRIAVSVEPTDSTLLPELALFDHRRGRFHMTLGSAPPLRVLILDPGGSVDTETFNRQCWKNHLRTLAGEHRRAFDLLRRGIAGADPESIGAAATMSARLHQTILHNQLLEISLTLAHRTGAVGVCRAHSGTVIGLLFDSRSFDEDRSLREITRGIPSGVTFRMTTIVDGGPRFRAAPLCAGRLRR